MKLMITDTEHNHQLNRTPVSSEDAFADQTPGRRRLAWCWVEPELQIIILLVTAGGTKKSRIP